MCERCNHGRRNAVEMIDPKTEEPILLCERCAGRAALGFLFKRQLPPVRRVHADDAALAMIVENGWQTKDSLVAPTHDRQVMGELPS